MSFDVAPGGSPTDDRQFPTAWDPPPRVNTQMRVAKPGIDWLGVAEALFRNRLGWLVSGSLVFAASPLVAWAASIPVEGDPDTVAIGASPAAAVAELSTGGARHGAPARPSTRYGGEPAYRTPAGSATFDRGDGRDGGKGVKDVIATAPGSVHPGDRCHPSYNGCVPIASDVDCIGERVPPGHDDGPAFVSGPLLVTGEDVFELDHNGDLVACYDGDR